MGYGDNCFSCGHNKHECSCDDSEAAGIPGVNGCECEILHAFYCSYWEGNDVEDFGIVQNDRGSSVLEKIMDKIRTIVVSNTGRIAGNLVDAVSIPIDMTVANVLSLTTTNAVGASRTIQNPTGGIGGQLLTINVTQGIGAPHTITWSNKFKFPANVPNQISQTAGMRDKYVFERNSVTDTYDCIGVFIEY